MEHLAHKAIWFPARIRIAGLRLAPLTLGTLRLLEATASPYILGGDATGADSGLALLVMALPWRLARRILARPRLASALGMLFALRVSPPDAIALGQWVAAELWTPDRFTAPGASPAAFPAVTGLATTLAQRCLRAGPAVTPFDRRSPWDYTVREATLLSIAQAEATGAEFTTREELA